MSPCTSHFGSYTAAPKQATLQVSFIVSSYHISFVIHSNRNNSLCFFTVILMFGVGQLSESCNSYSDQGSKERGIVSLEPPASTETSMYFSLREKNSCSLSQYTLILCPNCRKMSTSQDVKQIHALLGIGIIES